MDELGRSRDDWRVLRNALQVVLWTMALVGALVLHFSFSVSLGVALLIFFVGWPLGGTLVMVAPL